MRQTPPDQPPVPDSAVGSLGKAQPPPYKLLDHAVGATGATEGAEDQTNGTLAETIDYLVQRGIPVMAHIGLTPQSINTLGGFKTQGRQREQWAAIEADAKAVADAGAFSVVLEAMAEPLAAQITRAVPIPTIGIGASAACDGQILVMEDMLGLSPRVPKFVKEFGKVGRAIDRAIKMYADDVRTRSFPAPENTYDVKD